MDESDEKPPKTGKTITGELREKIQELLGEAEQLQEKLEELKQPAATANPSFLTQARQFLKDAQRYADDAYTSFGKTKPNRENFTKDVESLNRVKQSIWSLQRLLFNNSLPISGELLRNRHFISRHIDTAVEQIEKSLYRSLNRNEVGDFSKLQTALRAINNLFPSKTPSKDPDEHSW